jgi:Ser-tRNA(Ala) deacylase AlaX
VATVDAQPRQLHARLHSAGHVIGQVMANWDGSATKAHHWPGKARVVGVAAAADGAAQELVPAELERRCNDSLPRICPV